MQTLVMEKVPEQLSSYGLAGIFITVLLLGLSVVFLYYKASKEMQIKDLKETIKEKNDTIRRLEEKEDQRMRDVHEVMTDVKDAINSLVDIAKGFRELVNVMVDKKSP